MNFQDFLAFNFPARCAHTIDGINGLQADSLWREGHSRTQPLSVLCRAQQCWCRKVDVPSPHEALLYMLTWQPQVRGNRTGSYFNIKDHLSRYGDSYYWDLTSHQTIAMAYGARQTQGWGQIRFIKYKYKYKYIFFRSFKYKYKYKYTSKNLIKYKYKYKYSSSNTNTNTNTQWGRDKIAAILQMTLNFFVL